MILTPPELSHLLVINAWHETSITPSLHLLLGCFVWLLCLSAGRSWASFAGRSRNWWRRSWTSTGFWIPACILQPPRPSNVFKSTPADLVTCAGNYMMMVLPQEHHIYSKACNYKSISNNFQLYKQLNRGRDKSCKADSTGQLENSHQAYSQQKITFQRCTISTFQKEVLISVRPSASHSKNAARLHLKAHQVYSRCNIFQKMTQRTKSAG